MFLLRCCGFCEEHVERNTVGGNQSQPIDEPVTIEPLPDVTTLQLAHPSALPEKPASPSASTVIPAPSSVKWEVFEETSPGKEVNITPPIVVSAQLENAINEQVDMRSALDERISSREYILSITDEELSRFPVAFIESFYAFLSPGEIMQLEQRLCDLKAGIFSDERTLEPLSLESENFLKSYRPQLTVYTDTGFKVDNKRNNQSGFDIRQLILAAQIQKTVPLDWKILEQLQPFLSVIEFQNMTKKMGFRTVLQKQRPDLLLPGPAEYSTASSYGNIYPSTRDLSFFADKSLCPSNTVEQNGDEKLTSIRMTNVEPENEVSPVPNEQTVKSLINDLLLKL